MYHRAMRSHGILKDTLATCTLCAKHKPGKPGETPLYTQIETKGDTIEFYVPFRMKRHELASLLRGADSPDALDKAICGVRSQRSLLEVATDLLAFEHMRKAIPGLEGMLGDPVWLILLDLFVRESHGKTTSVSSATIASGAPATSALRYITTLTSIGIIIRRAHPNDERSALLSLSNDARSAICSILKKAR